jgi:hypothetical protein
MTLLDIIAAVSKFKPVGRRQIIRYRDALKIMPLGVRQRPQQYPADAAERILQHLGLSAVPPTVKSRVTTFKTNRRAAGIITMKQINKAWRKSK